MSEPTPLQFYEPALSEEGDAWGEEPDVPLGALLGGRYRVERLLGKGGMASVYQVTHVGLGRPMAAKVLRAELVGISDLMRRFLREARAAAAIDHRNVVRITDFGVLEPARAYVVMELLRGQPLRALLANGPLPPERVAHIARQVAAGLAAAHAAGVVHRDLKPDNVQVDVEAGDAATVLDFGLASLVGATRLTRRGVVFGTPQYMSPEQAAGDLVDGRTDIYALGVMMYEMLTGVVPFDAPAVPAILRQHLTKAPRPLAQVGKGRGAGPLEAVVMRCLAKQPARRYPNMAALAEALDPVVTSASPPRVEVSVGAQLAVPRGAGGAGGRRSRRRWAAPGRPSAPALLAGGLLSALLGGLLGSGLLGSGLLGSGLLGSEGRPGRVSASRPLPTVARPAPTSAGTGELVELATSPSPSPGPPPQAFPAVQSLPRASSAREPLSNRGTARASRPVPQAKPAPGSIASGTEEIIAPWADAPGAGPASGGP